ncbi:hypothetical protein LTR95_015066 [Oleoguttula sp. CCFEE 5521]
MANVNVSALPPDLLHLIATELSARLDFPTLFNYTCASKQIASSGAINALYRVSHDSPLKAGGSEDLPLAEQDLIKRKWSILWRTIILSTFGETLYPYAKHLRVLDLRDLGDLLDDDKFRQGPIEKHFFSGILLQFYLTITPAVKIGTRSRPKLRLDTQNIISAIGDAITQHAPLLEGLTEPKLADNLSTALTTWAPRLTYLRRLDLWDGRALADDRIRNLLHVHCPHLDSLRMYHWSGSDADQHLAAFISGMQPNKLMEFENLSHCNIGIETCLALNTHGASLRTLKLALAADGVLALGNLQGCTSLEILSIDSLGPTPDLKAAQNDIYLDITAWLKTCTYLENIFFANLPSAPDLLIAVLLNEEVKLRSLAIKSGEGFAYLAKDHRTFHDSLTNQQTLEALLLSADAEGAGFDDLQALNDTLCSLKNLRTLHLYRISDYYNDTYLNALARNLLALEELYIGGLSYTDDVWTSISGLNNMRSLTFEGFSAFSVDGIIEYISSLNDSNRGLVLSIDRAETETAISEEGQELIRQALAAKIPGSRFQYALARDPNIQDFDSDDSD